MGKTFKRFNKSQTNEYRHQYSEEMENDFETFGYEVSNAKRTPKNKKTIKFRDYYDYQW